MISEGPLRNERFQCVNTGALLGGASLERLQECQVPESLSMVAQSRS